MPLSCYLKIYPDPQRPGHHLLYSTKKGSLVRLSEAKLAAIRDNTLSESDRATLKRLELLVDDPAAEREAMANIVAKSNERSTNFSATVVLTMACNLACPYCFEEEFRRNQQMTAETADLLVVYIQQEQIAKGRDVQIRFYGGEPLMALPMLKRIAAELQQAARNQGTKFSCTMVTNATLLTPEVVEELLPLGLTAAQVTLDGPREIHDPQRPFVSGKGSFDTILANIAAVHRLVTLKPGGNFTRDNYTEFPKMLDAMLAAGIDPQRLDPVVFAPILPKSGSNTIHDATGCCRSCDEPWLAEASLLLRQETLRRGFKVEKPAMGACMVEFANDMVVNWDGAIYKCPGFMGWPELCIGTLATGIRDYSASHNLNLWQNDECLACPYLPLCFGGCRLLTFMKTGAMDDVACRRDFYDATLEQMVVQDLPR
ncbi:geopeptide radical SAM maturase [Geobacter pelophilus]|uniref:Geopeptide radical SAM maturase n=1 Tax=Geoanaerobacter pelophilus TaxID=60036 RepID=A0AAW4LBW4_9BACT|nr:geopeptide radical SAM maturase [Geoanaerobacter pelophilus]MBT0665514.1 geopeptide radical SAM maturase [Geoanaerobacter pelophilus]